LLIELKRKIFIPFIFILILRVSYAQSTQIITTKTDSFIVSPDNKYYLSSLSPLPGSFELYLNNKLLAQNDFIYNVKNNFISLSDSVHYSLMDTLIIKYKLLKLKLSNIYRHNKEVRLIQPNNISEKQLLKIENTSLLKEENIFGKKIKKSGTILRGFSIGTNNAFKINSGLRLQLSGKLSDDLSIVAALTDENTPIQPEGNTERLNELDKVFIQINHPLGKGVFGDFDFKINSGTFGKINRKLQGVFASFHVKNSFVKFTFASSKGKFTTNKINGIDGVQGPYRLYGKNNERDIIIIAGSERVYLDGMPLKRGENNDYIIEYSNASITFTPKRVITSASRITVDFEYTDEKYKREFWGINSGMKLWKNKLKIDFSLFNEGDNKSNPIDAILTEKEKKILTLAGDNPLKAVISGITIAKTDSLGFSKGTYEKKDTLINGKNYSYYIFNPGSPLAIYNIKFSFVGAGKGDYKQISIGHFKFIGIGKGSYLPIIFLPLPENKKNANVTIKALPSKNLLLSLDLAGSLFDKNTFSFRDDKDNSGFANKINLQYLPTAIKLFGYELGKISFALSNRFIDNNYSSLDRFNSIEFNRDFNIPTNIDANQNLFKAKVSYLPAENIKIESSFNKLNSGKKFFSQRFVEKTTVNNFYGFTLNHFYDILNSKNNFAQTNWVRQNGLFNYTFGKLTPGIFYLFEKKEEKSTTDSLLNSSYEYFEVAPFLKIFALNGVSFNAKYSFREESFPLKGVLQLQSKAIMQAYTFKYNGIRGLSSSLDLVIRNKNYSPQFSSSQNLNTKSLLIRFYNRLNLFNRFLEGNFYYQTATEKTAKLQKVFIQVPAGNGNYIYLGDLNKDGIAEENEFQQTIYNGNYILTLLPTNELFPTIGVKTNARFYLNFKRLFKGNNLLSKILKTISTETFYRIEEKSTEEKLNEIYLLNLKYFLNDSTTINGNQFFQNDFFIFRNNSKFSLRFRYKQKKSLNQFSNGIVRTYFRENSLRARIQLVKEIRNQTDLIFQSINKASPLVLNRTFAINLKKLSSEFFYYPYNNLQISFKVEGMRAENIYPEKPAIIDENNEGLTITYYFRGRGRLSVLFERKEFITNSKLKNIPFEITEGNIIGKNYLFSLNLDYRLADNLRITFNYLARKKGIEKVINYLRAEARAYF